MSVHDARLLPLLLTQELHMQRMDDAGGKQVFAVSLLRNLVRSKEAF